MTAVAFRNRGKNRDASDDGGVDEGVDVDHDGGDADEDLADDENGEWLAYELHEWASESRSMLAQLLLADEVPHSWQGTTLLAHQTVEAQVDALLEEVEQAEVQDLDPAEPKVAFEVDGWSGDLQAQLAERLGQGGVPHEFDADGDLVCHEADEEQVELVIDELLARVADEGLEQLDGLDANALLSSLFTATDRLKKDVHDAKGILGVLEHGRRLAGTATPFGFAATAWTALRDAATTLCDLIEDEESTDAEVVDLAVRLRDTLQRLI